MVNVHGQYLRNLGTLLKESALDARARANGAKGTPDGAFEEGRALAYWEVLSTMQSQALPFQLFLSDLGLEGFNPDRDLL